MSSLILLRHGQAAFGADHYDSISERGRQQALVAGRHFAGRGLRPTRVWLGPRQRHRVTAELALAPLGLTPPEATEAALDEFAEGQQILAAAETRQGVRLRGEGALSGAESARRYAAEIDAWAENRTVIDGVPPVARFRHGVAQWLRRATVEPDSGQTVLAVTSGGVIAALLAIVLDLPDARLGPFMNAIHNGSVTELVFSRGRTPALVSFNGTGHLPGNLLTRI